MKIIETTPNDDSFQSDIFSHTRRYSSFLQILPGILKQGHAFFKTNAFVDIGSDATQVKSDIAARLNLDGIETKF